jgi:phosphoglucomutase
VGGTIRAILTTVPGTGESIAGLKAVTDDEWLAVRPSGIEEVKVIE